MNISNQPPTKARAQALFHAFEIGRALVGRDDHLTVLVNQRVEGMEELFLRGVRPMMNCTSSIISTSTERNWSLKAWVFYSATP
jgi:hypothetical protein